MSFSFVLYDENGTQLFPRAPLTFSLLRSADTPVDSLKAVFLQEDLFSREIAEVEINSSKGVFFSGVIDEQDLLISSSGQWVTLTGRSRAALLCDNEALPAQYLETGIDSIFERHVRPYGFSSVEAARQPPLPSFLVAKGESELDVLSRFCLLGGYPSPRFSADNRLILKWENAHSTLSISNTAKGAIPFLSISRKLARHTCISEIYLKNKDGIYSTLVENPHALAHNIRRKRYLAPANEWAIRGDLDARRRIADSMYNRLVIETEIPGLHAVQLYDRVLLDDGTVSRSYAVMGIKWRRTTQGDSTVLVLTEPEYLSGNGGTFNVDQ